MILEVEKSVDESTCTCMNIMIVDDDAFNLNTLKTSLSIFEAYVCEALDGQDAVELFTEKLEANKCEKCYFWNYIFMDLNMPIMDGGKATACIRKIMEDLIKLDYNKGYNKENNLKIFC